MNPERWRRITGLFHAALAHDSGRRAVFLDAACADDPSLRGDVERLLAGDRRAESAGDFADGRSGGLAPGAMLGPYRIEASIGAGGMGDVYRARDTRLNRTVAIKVLPPAFVLEPEVRQRFEREAHAIAALKHPHICVLHDVGRQDGLDFLVMEYLEGETLEDRLKKGPLPVDRALPLAIDIADALDSAHRT